MNGNFFQLPSSSLICYFYKNMTLTVLLCLMNRYNLGRVYLTKMQIDKKMQSTLDKTCKVYYTKLAKLT